MNGLQIIPLDPLSQSFVIDTTCTNLEGYVLIKLAKPIKNPKIVVEFRGVCESRWELCGRLATKPESTAYKVNKSTKNIVSVQRMLHESKEPLMPSPMGNATSYPFNLKLPKSTLPPSFEGHSGCIQYSVRCIVTSAESILSKTTKEAEVPVVVRFSDEYKMSAIMSSTEATLRHDGSNEKAGYVLYLPTRTTIIGDSLEVALSITKTPAHARLRLFKASLRLGAAYTDEADGGRCSNAKFPRPLSELTQNFPLIKIGGQGGMEQPVFSKFHLMVDPELALQSLSSPLITIQTVLRVDIVLDNTENANISLEVPITVLDRFENRRVSDQSPVSDRFVSRTDSVPESLYSMASVMTDTSRRSTVMAGPLTPTGTSYKAPWTDTTLATEYANLSLHKLELERAKSHRHHRQRSAQFTILDSPTSPTIVVPELRRSKSQHGPRPRSTHRGARASTVPALLGPNGPTAPVSDAQDLQRLEQLSPDQVVAWLAQFEPTSEVVEAFLRNGVDGTVLLHLTESDMKVHLGITSLGFRRKLLMALGSMNV